jgi:hypothetical protein
LQAVLTLALESNLAMDMHSVGLFANLASELWHLETLPWKFPDVAWEPSFGTFLGNLA